MVSNDNGQTSSSPPPPHDEAYNYDEMSLRGGPSAVALGLAQLDAAHSMGLAMQNAVVEQQNGWAMQRIVMVKAVDQLLRNNAGDRAVDALLRQFTQSQQPQS